MAAPHAETIYEALGRLSYGGKHVVRTQRTVHAAGQHGFGL